METGKQGTLDRY